MKYIVLGIPDDKYDSLMRQMALDRNFSECEITEISEEHGNIADDNKPPRQIDKNAKSIREPGYSVVLNQALKVGTHIFSLGTAHEQYMVHESIITDGLCVDSSGYPCVILQGVDVPIKMQERIELLACSIHSHDMNDFLTKEEAEAARGGRLGK